MTVLVALQYMDCLFVWACFSEGPSRSVKSCLNRNGWDERDATKSLVSLLYFVPDFYVLYFPWNEMLLKVTFHVLSFVCAYRFFFCQYTRCDKKSHLIFHFIQYISNAFLRSYPSVDWQHMKSVCNSIFFIGPAVKQWFLQFFPCSFQSQCQLIRSPLVLDVSNSCWLVPHLTISKWNLLCKLLMYLFLHQVMVMTAVPSLSLMVNISQTVTLLLNCYVLYVMLC